MFFIIIVSSFTYLSIIINEDTNGDVNIIEQPVINLGPSNDEIINDYINEYNNHDVVGEIKIINTDYKKAIMQSNDNDYYLNHLEDKTSNFMGSIYLDFRIDIDNSDKLLIYGHNSSNVDMPFKLLENYYNEDYYKSHKYVQILTKNKTRLYEIYAILIETNDFSYMKTEFKNKDEWYRHISGFKNKSLYNTDVSVSENDKIIILQTCSTHSNYKKYNKKYLLVVGKEIDNN